MQTKFIGLLVLAFTRIARLAAGAKSCEAVANTVRSRLFGATGAAKGGMVLGLALALAASGPAASAARGTFTRMYFRPPPDGRVGYHLYSIIHTEDNDTPTGDVTTCSPTADGSALTVRGEPPPGIVFEAAGPDFQGTPRQPGVWSVVVDVPAVWCANGPDVTHYGPRSVVVKFNISP